MTRHDFLAKIWKKYPTATNPSSCGRFLQIVDEELMVTSDGEKPLNLSVAKFVEGPPVQGILLSGDWIEILKMGDQKHVTELRLLAPCLNSPKVHPYHLFRDWMRFQTRVRNFFNSKGFDELQTPTIVSCPGTEPTLNPFKTEWILGAQRQNLYLPTSPELHLKKCLSRGWQKIFEIRPCFRNGELTEVHQPEFFMLEWYRAFEPLKSIEGDIQSLIEYLTGGAIVIVRKTMAALFLEHCEFKLTPTTTAAELINCCRRWGVTPSLDSDYNDLFYYLYVQRIEPRLKQYKYLIVENYPPSQAALARINNEGWAERFEFYINGVEIANAFHELNDPDAQASRFQADNDDKLRMLREPVSLDEDFMVHLRSGLPPSSGVALGVDRLFMVLNELTDISSFRLFPIS